MNDPDTSDDSPRDESSHGKAHQGKAHQGKAHHGKDSQGDAHQDDVDIQDDGTSNEGLFNADPENGNPENADFENADFEDDEDAFSLEELGAAYKHIVAQSENGDGQTPIETGEVLQRDQLRAAQAKADAEAIAAAQAAAELAGADAPYESDDAPPDPDSTDDIATPDAIIESALFVGQPSGDPVSATRLASIMRDMTPDEVTEIIDRLNASYRENRQGIRIAQDETGYRMIVAPEVESMRHVFTGKVRETRLNQSSIEVLSLVAYQPGISSQQCTDLRGRDSGSLLNQMVRRRLIEVRREPEDRDPSRPDKTKAKPKMVSRYYPAERLLVLLGLESLEDLPQVEEVHLE